MDNPHHSDIAQTPVLDLLSQDAAPMSDTYTADAHYKLVQDVGLNLLAATPFILDGEGQIQWTDSVRAAYILRATEVLLPHDEDSFMHRLSPEHQGLRRRALKTLTWDGAQYSVEYQFQTYDGQSFWIEERGQRLEGHGSQTSKIMAVLRHIDARRREEEKCVYKASYDPLTGLWNQARFAEGLNYLLSLSDRYKRPAGILALRLINLDDINQTYGYDAGDRLLRLVANRLRDNVRFPDMVARLNETDFAIAVTDYAPATLEKLADRLQAVLSDAPYPGPQGNLYTELAMGGMEPTHSPDQALSHVMTCLIRSAVLQGRYVAYSDEMSANASGLTRKALTEKDIRDALETDRLSLAYQPIIETRTHALHHYECLLRVRRDDGDIISAWAFVLAAEKLGLVHLLDNRALELASVTLRDDPDIHLALNVSAETVKTAETADAYLERLSKLGGMAKRVTLELTETAALDDPAMASRFSVAARALGCGFSIDDFGAGYTTFQNLMTIEADTIKIDGSFIQDIALVPHKQTFVRMIVDLAQTFSVKTVAEMVDNQESADLLKRLGVDYLQGYLFGIPSPAPNWQS